ncbi:putative amidohydrolase family protein [Rosellinia necatrix]|uniref:Putative amidohydrolase family protein n=1 Tax=Rosellinia necatrix TaxID=77044 RepID=A0A1W2TD37_ROSNE|nr:putative amidohydrolase family protein [Rosellinia necatrix]
MATDIPIIDAHVHLYPESEVPTLAWCPPEHPLAKQQSVEEYRTASASSPPKGFIVIEADRKNDLDAGARDGSGWEGPLAEIAWLKRIATGQPKPGEGHSEGDASLCAAYIPWAPLPSGPAVMEKYIGLAKKEAGETWSKVRGFRYLVQDKPNGTMLQDEFIESLKLLGREGLVFELGVDQHRRGRGQLEEVVEMIDRAHEGVPEDEKVVFIINHMCKPDLEVYNTHTSTSFIAWRTAMFTLSKCGRTYMKLSGGFSEMPESLRQRPPEDIFEALVPWLTIILAAFGADRIMFASDWPVCTVGVGDGAWNKWKKIVERLCWMASFDDEQKKMIWGGTALKAYGIES